MLNHHSIIHLIISLTLTLFSLDPTPSKVHLTLEFLLWAEYKYGRTFTF